MAVEVGQTASLSKTILDEDVRQFAQLVGDYNPVHLDDDFAKKTRFGRRIAHGMWGASLISTVVGTQLPGPGTIYLSQSLDFKAPVFLGDTITAEATVTHVREDKPIVTLDTVCRNQRGELVLKGVAVVLSEGMDG
jgi:3-hydroxybutyryl-CoA dehydratase